MTDHLGYILAVVSLTLMIALVLASLFLVIAFVVYVVKRLWGGKK